MLQAGAGGGRGKRRRGVGAQGSAGRTAPAGEVAVGGDLEGAGDGTEPDDARPRDGEDDEEQRAGAGRDLEVALVGHRGGGAEEDHHRHQRDRRDDEAPAGQACAVAKSGTSSALGRPEADS